MIAMSGMIRIAVLITYRTLTHDYVQLETTKTGLRTEMKNIETLKLFYDTLLSSI